MELPLCKCSSIGVAHSCAQRIAYSAKITEIERGFEKGYRPWLTDDGTSGCYMLRGPNRKPAAVFKPIDEEQFAPNNPRDFSGPFGSSTFRPGIFSGESTIREIAAYLLDHNNFSGVPMTQMVSITHNSFRSSDCAQKGFPPLLDSASCGSFNSSELAGQSILLQVHQLLNREFPR